MKLELHRCKMCGTRWLLWPAGVGGTKEAGWNLLDRYSKPGACCDNAPMGEQIEHLRDFELGAQLLAQPSDQQIEHALFIMRRIRMATRYEIDEVITTLNKVSVQDQEQAHARSIAQRHDEDRINAALAEVASLRGQLAACPQTTCSICGHEGSERDPHKAGCKWLAAPQEGPTPPATEAEIRDDMNATHDTTGGRWK